MLLKVRDMSASISKETCRTETCKVSRRQMHFLFFLFDDVSTECRHLVVVGRVSRAEVFPPFST
jgi:hypothetical protein